MLTKTIICLLFTVSTLSSFAQQNITFSPEKPKPGEPVTVTYEPAGDIANSILPVEAVVYQKGKTKQKADDLMLEKSGRKYTGRFTADTAVDFIYLSFSSDKKFDNNYNEGYYLHLFENGEPKRGSFLSLSQFYQFLGGQTGVERNNEKALAAMEKEFSLFPDTRKQNLSSYMRLLTTVKKDAAPALVQKEIESQLKTGLKEEADYDNISNLYNMAKLPEQAKLITGFKKEKYPEGNWTINEKIQKFFGEQDISKKEAMLAEIIQKTETDKKWEATKASIPFFKSQMINAYIAKKEWARLKTAAIDITDKAQLASLYNNTAWEMQKTSDNLPLFFRHVFRSATGWVFPLLFCIFSSKF